MHLPECPTVEQVVLRCPVCHESFWWSPPQELHPACSGPHRKAYERRILTEWAPELLRAPRQLPAYRRASGSVQRYQEQVQEWLRQRSIFLHDWIVRDLDEGLISGELPSLPRPGTREYFVALKALAAWASS